MNILFICNVNKNRSLTAEHIMKENKKHSVRSAGLYAEEDKKLTKEHMNWADIIFIMEENMRADLSKMFPKQSFIKRVISLDIPDIYKVDQPELIQALKKAITKNKHFLEE